MRRMTAYEGLGLALILLGVLCKTMYIIAKAQSGEYRAGNELLFLFIGLLLFLSGMYIRSMDQNMINPLYLIATGLGLKLVFIIRFVQKVRTLKKHNEN